MSGYEGMCGKFRDDGEGGTLYVNGARYRI